MRLFLVAVMMTYIVPRGLSPRCFATFLTSDWSIRTSFSFFCLARIMTWDSPRSIPVISMRALAFFVFSCVSLCSFSHPWLSASSMMYASEYFSAFPWSMVSILTSGGICTWLNIFWRRESLPILAK